MRVTLTIQSGARSGVAKSFDQAYVGLGRHPQSDLQFHPEHDLDASTRHAALLKQGDGWSLRDLGSANGTFVNGEKVHDDRPLHTGDVITLGPKGPSVLVEIQGQAPPARASVPGTQVAGAVAGGSTTQRIRVEVAKQTQGLRRATLVLFGLLILVAAGYFWQKSLYERKLADQRAEMLRQVDSLQRSLESVTVRFGALQGALDSAQAVTAQLRRQIEAGGDPQAMAQLRAELTSAITRQRSLSAAAGLDAAHVDSIAGDAVGMVYARMPSGGTYTGTAFAIRSDDSGVYAVTNRHVVTSPEGADPVEIGVMFNHSNQLFRATLVRKHPAAGVDLALLRIVVRGGAPTVPGIADDPAVVGQPVVAIGFPLGVDVEGGRDFRRIGAVATLTAGTISRLTPDVVQIDGYGATGASGSPYLDAHGHVVAVLYGGAPESNGRIVYAVPATRIGELFGR
ncbi:MAG TPA: trypsin-like peptidase domain-containing protein [Gemmatimonadales bacterium]|nr:trypsin-like peptidase domain-containing protein [Gemmatimonadales bacterium]